jgi:hypothetical protein
LNRTSQQFRQIRVVLSAFIMLVALTAKAQVPGDKSQPAALKDQSTPRNGKTVVQSMQEAGMQPVVSRNSPVSVAFLGYTNGPPATDIMPSLSDQTEALFVVTNHSSSRVTYQLRVDGFKPGQATAETQHSEPGFLAGHAVDVIRVFSPGGSNQWRFLVVLSTPANAVVYPPVTNEWSTP